MTRPRAGLFCIIAIGFAVWAMKPKPDDFESGYAAARAECRQARNDGWLAYQKGHSLSPGPVPFGPYSCWREGWLKSRAERMNNTDNIAPIFRGPAPYRKTERGI